MTPVLLVLLAYVLGATPTSHLIGRGLYGVDLRTRGSGNLGATNAYRLLGWKAAVPVVVVDVTKGWIPVALFPGLDGGVSWGWTLAYGGAAIFGHVVSFWVGFRGGKGVATSAGVFLALAPVAVLVAAAVWTLVLASVRIVSAASLAAAVTIPAVVAVRGHPGGSAMLWFTLALAAFVFWAHRANLHRLMRGEEPRIRQGERVAAPDPLAGATGRGQAR